MWGIDRTVDDQEMVFETPGFKPAHASKMVPPLRLELRTSGSTNRRSNQLS
jgi:hypothetical protein